MRCILLILIFLIDTSYLKAQAPQAPKDDFKGSPKTAHKTPSADSSSDSNTNEEELNLCLNRFSVDLETIIPKEAAAKIADLAAQVKANLKKDCGSIDSDLAELTRLMQAPSSPVPANNPENKPANNPEKPDQGMSGGMSGPPSNEMSGMPSENMSGPPQGENKPGSPNNNPDMNQNSQPTTDSCAVNPSLCANLINKIITDISNKKNCAPVDLAITSLLGVARQISVANPGAMLITLGADTIYTMYKIIKENPQSLRTAKHLDKAQKESLVHNLEVMNSCTTLEVYRNVVCAKRYKDIISEAAKDLPRSRGPQHKYINKSQEKELYKCLVQVNAAFPDKADQKEKKIKCFDDLGITAAAATGYSEEVDDQWATRAWAGDQNLLKKLLRYSDNHQSSSLRDRFNSFEKKQKEVNKNKTNQPRDELETVADDDLNGIVNYCFNLYLVENVKASNPLLNKSPSTNYLKECGSVDKCLKNLKLATTESVFFDNRICYGLNEINHINYNEMVEGLRNAKFDGKGRCEVPGSDSGGSTSEQPATGVNQ